MMDTWHGSSQLVNGSTPTPQSSTSALELLPTGAGPSALRTAVHRLPRQRSKTRRRKRAWKKLLWVKQPYPDNYTDEETFLDHLQRNPRLQPYEFWPLVADASVIVQQVSTVVVFVCCFSCILQARVSPVTMVSGGTVATVLGWIIWHVWVGQEKTQQLETRSSSEHAENQSSEEKAGKERHMGLGVSMTEPAGLSKEMSDHTATNGYAQFDFSETPSSTSVVLTKGAEAKRASSISRPSSRSRRRLETAKSALLIYCALLGLSPILKSLTMSTASDSIWAISFWLMCINIFFFDYGGGVGATFPASLSTNAALMASTVLASRLPSTTHVFSLTLFSIEVFGLFPVFRRYLRLQSFIGHLGLTVFLVMGAGGGVAVSASGGSWIAAILGILLGSVLTGLAMGLCSWWLIGLQQYKNEIHGPWDPARPVIRRKWD